MLWTKGRGESHEPPCPIPRERRLLSQAELTPYLAEQGNPCHYHPADHYAEGGIEQRRNQRLKHYPYSGSCAPRMSQLLNGMMHYGDTVGQDGATDHEHGRSTHDRKPLH